MHNDCRRDGPAPAGVITPGLTEAVAGYLPDNPNRLHRRMDDAPSLDAADCPSVFPVADENKLTAPIRKIEAECAYSLLVERNGSILPCFLLGDGNMRAELALFLIIDIRPFEAEEVADSEHRMNSQHDQHVVAELAAFQKVFAERL